MKLSEHFSLEEMVFSQTATRRGIPNAPNGTVVNNLTRLCQMLESIRAHIERPIIITSGYRSQALNTFIGGAKNSQHCLGCAADFVVRGMPVEQIMQVIIASDIPFDQVINEYGKWTHASVTKNEGNVPRREALIIDEKGVRKYGI